MKISEQGFTERIASQANRSGTVSDAAQGGANTSRRSASSDTLQLSNLASRLQNTSLGDAGRAARLTQIAKAVQAGTFQIDSSRISRAVVSEAVQTEAG